MREPLDSVEIYGREFRVAGVVIAPIRGAAAARPLVDSEFWRAFTDTPSTLCSSKCCPHRFRAGTPSSPAGSRTGASTRGEPATG